MDTLPIVDYAAHPAYADTPARMSEPEVEALISEIDAAYERASTADCQTGNHVSDPFAREVEPRLQKLMNLVANHESVRASFSGFVKDAFVEARQFLAASLQAKRDASARRNSAMSDLTSQQTGLVTALRQDGFANFENRPDLARSVFRKTWLERAILRAKARLSPRRHCAVALHARSPASKAVADAVRDCGLLEVASAYMGRPMEFFYAALDHAHPAQDWYKGCYADSGLPTSRTAYMHFDADAEMLKAMFYIADVGPGDGPFSFVKGSHLWGRSPVICAIQNGFDAAQRKAFEAEPDGLDYKLGYYRPRFHVPESRRDILALPPQLRGSTHFGDDILDGTATSDELLRKEVVFTGPAGTLVLFDGSRGIHRGSMAARGRRWAVQIGLRVKRGDAAPPSRRLRGLKDTVRHLQYGLRQVWALRMSFGRRNGIGEEAGGRR